jgi:hypothetical protein
MSVLFGMVTPGDVGSRKPAARMGARKLMGVIAIKPPGARPENPELAEFGGWFRRLWLDFAGPSRLIGPTKDNAAQKRGATCTPIAAIPAPI